MHPSRRSTARTCSQLVQPLHQQVSALPEGPQVSLPRFLPSEQEVWHKGLRAGGSGGGSSGRQQQQERAGSPSCRLRPPVSRPRQLLP